MMDWEDSSSSGSASEEEEDRWNPHRAVPSVRNADTSNSRGSILGLQLALAEGWISQRARDLCSFSHDRYRQAVLAETENLPPEVRARMSSRVKTSWPSSICLQPDHIYLLLDCLDDVA